MNAWFDVALISDYEDVRPWISMLFSAAAGWANFIAMYEWRESRWPATLYGATGFLAWFYTGAYVYLIISGDPVQFQRFIANFSPLVFLLVWSVPPLVSARAHRNDIEKLACTTKDIDKHLAQRDTDGRTLS